MKLFTAFAAVLLMASSVMAADSYTVSKVNSDASHAVGTLYLCTGEATFEYEDDDPSEDTVYWIQLKVTVVDDYANVIEQKTSTSHISRNNTKVTLSEALAFYDQGTTCYHLTVQAWIRRVEPGEDPFPTNAGQTGETVPTPFCQ